MSPNETIKTSLVSDITQSFQAYPTWVKLWMNFVLGPINVAALFFIGQPGGPIVAILALLGMVLTILPVPFERGFSKATAFGHIVPWTVLIGIILLARPEGSAAFDVYLTVLLVLNTISLGFDYVSAYKWIKGDRIVVGAPQG